MADFTGNKEWFGKPHTNMTLDRPVVSHSSGNWDKLDTYIMPTQSFIDQTLS